MSYSLYSRNGWIEHLGNASGYWLIIEVVEASRKKGPLYDFIQKGETTDVKAVLKDIDNLLLRTSGLAKARLKLLRNSLSKCKQIAIVSD
jgi:hypothetical protein